MAKFSILHISDLHRDQVRPLSNLPLQTSILKDIKDNQQHFEEIKLIIVSGDLIQGSNNPDLIKAEEEVKEQYEEAFCFLESLAKEVLNNKKDFLILVPGNHDIFWPDSKASMEKILTDETSHKRHVEDLKLVNSKIRWSWNETSFYKIQDNLKYNKRLRYFKEFYDRWYQGERTFALEPESQFEIFDYPDLDTTVVGLNSCYNNDHLCQCGDFCADALSSMYIELNKIGVRPLRIGVWHHNTSGGPRDNNYLHNHYLQNLIQFEFNIGLHGHQHKTETVNSNAKYFNSNSIVTISAGSLCAGKNNLPTGEARQFNILEIDSIISKFKLFIRKSINIDTDLPIWDRGSLNNNSDLSHEVGFNLHRNNTMNDKENINQVINLYGERKFLEALSLINSQKDTDFLRKIKIECLRELHKHSELTELLKTPNTDQECFYLLEALRNYTDKKRAKKILKIVDFQKFQENNLLMDELQKLKKWLEL